MSPFEICNDPAQSAVLTNTRKHQSATSAKQFIASLSKTRVQSRSNLKRFFEVVASLSLIIVLFPLFVVVALWISLRIGQPVIIWHRRLGLEGQPFKLYKFRTQSAVRVHGGTQELSKKIEVLEKSGLDKLPYLFNILRGDLSFVGPRPSIPMEKYLGYFPLYAVKPGIFSMIPTYDRSHTTPEDKLALDEWYARNASFSTDITILFQVTLKFFFISARSNERVITRARLEMWGAQPLRANDRVRS